MKDSNSSPVNCHLYLTPTGERDYTRWCQWPDSINIATVPMTFCHVPVGPHSSEDHLACMNPLTRLSNHVYPPTIRSSAALGDIHPTQRTFDRNSSGSGACVHIGHGNAERFEGWCPPPSSTNGAARESTGRWCTGVSTNPPSRRYSEHTRQNSSRFLCQPCVLAAQCTALQGPPRVRDLAKSPAPCQPLVPARTGDGSDNFFQTTSRGACRAAVTRVCTFFLSDPCRAGGIGRDDLIEPQLRRNLTPRTRTTRSINGEVG